MNNGYGAGIAGTGSALPSKILTNADIERIVDTSDEWITTRTGIKQRYIACEETTSSLATEASKKAIASAGLGPGDIDGIILSTSAPDMFFPSSACLVQGNLGISNNCMAFDLSAACTGFVYALAMAEMLIKSSSFKNMLVIGSDVLSKMVDWEDRSTCILFGDAAGAVVVTRTEKDTGILKSVLHANGLGADMLKIPGGGTADPASAEMIEERRQFIKMNGSEVFKFAVRIIPETCLELIDGTGLEMNDVDYLIPHQANDRIIEASASKMDIEKSKIFRNLDKYGNTSTASIPLALDELNSEKKLSAGDIIITAGFGAGLTWGGNLIKWAF